MKELTEVLTNASRNVGEEYFDLRIAGALGTIYRERVYCYELYHQMRLLWPCETKFRLNGEVDKAAHPVLKRLDADRAKPDFLIHRPGDMSGNHGIIEVKHSRTTRGEAIQKDLETLKTFKESVGYLRAIYLIYGSRSERTAELIVGTANRFDSLPPIELWLHQAPGEPATHHLTLL